MSKADDIFRRFEALGQAFDDLLDEASKKLPPDRLKVLESLHLVVRKRRRVQGRDG